MRPPAQQATFFIVPARKGRERQPVVLIRRPEGRNRKCSAERQPADRTCVTSQMSRRRRRRFRLVARRLCASGGEVMSLLRQPPNAEVFTAGAKSSRCCWQAVAPAGALPPGAIERPSPRRSPRGRMLTITAERRHAPRLPKPQKPRSTGKCVFPRSVRVRCHARPVYSACDERRCEERRDESRQNVTGLLRHR